ncbi:helix-turn-helix domain-containing protein [Dysosmobacter sp. Phy]
MSIQCFKSIDELPIMLTIPQVAMALSISRSGAYELAHQKRFPAMQVDSRIVVPKERLLSWIEERVSQGI